jgi:hypothetical protein
MKLKKLLILLGGGAIAFAPLAAYADQPTFSNTQSSPQAQSASTFHPGFWQPVTRINPSQPFQLVVENQSSLPLEYGLTTGETRSLAARSETFLNYVSAPSQVLIYSPVANSSLRYDVSSANNTVFVRVRQRLSDTPGNGSLAITQTGAIYVY